METATCLPGHPQPSHDSLLMLVSRSNTLLIARARQGIPAVDVRDLLAATRLQTTHLAQALGITPLTLARRLRQTSYVFKGKDAATVIRVAKVLTHAAQVFRLPEHACHWLESANPTLPGAEKPISFLDTEFGAALVTEALYRIEHGIFA